MYKSVIFKYLLILIKMVTMCTYAKKLEYLLLWEFISDKPMSLKLRMMDEELRRTIVCLNDEPGSTLTFFMTTSIFSSPEPKAQVSL